MKNSLRTRLVQMQGRQQELNNLLADAGIAADQNKFRAFSKEYAEIGEPVRLYEQYLKAEDDLKAAHDMLADPDMRDMAEEEIGAAKTLLPALEAELQKTLLPKDPDDERDVFLEIRAGTGGEESALFAGDLVRMYTRYAERMNWKCEFISTHQSDLKGFKEAIIKIMGKNVYGQLKFESGGHRVQRVPETEAQGRIHTSACTVAVIAEADEAEAVQINPSELRIDTFRASGAGGQHINKTDSAVRITHLPTGLVVECQDDRSQHRNKAQALGVLAARLKQKQRDEIHAKQAAERKGLIGTGDRSDRIRTYNFPQGRITDHRVNLTLYKLAYMMDGDIQELLNGLQTFELAERLAEFDAA